MSASLVPSSSLDYSDVDSSSDTSSNFAPSISDTGNINTKIAIASIVVFLLSMSTFFTLHLITKWLFRRFFTAAHRRRSSPSSDGLQFAPTLHDLSHDAPRGLDKELICRLLPAFPHKNHQKSQHFAADCAVCLSEFEDNEMLRLLPNCGHCFHADCIDMWFFSHSTCPLCRKPAATPIPPASDSANAVELPSDRSDQTVIDILVVDPNSASEPDQSLRLHDSSMESDATSAASSSAAPPYSISCNNNNASSRQDYSRSNSDFGAGFHRLLPKPAASDPFLRTISNRRIPHITIQIPPPEIPCSTSSTPKPSSFPSAPSSTRPITPRCGASFDLSPQLPFRNSIKRMLSRQSSSCRSSNSLTCGVGSSADHEHFLTNLTMATSCDRSPKDQQGTPANRPQL